MGCQKEIARQIIEVEADYLLAVKEKQGHLEECWPFGFEGDPNFARTVNKEVAKPGNAGSSRTPLGLSPKPAAVGQTHASRPTERRPWGPVSNPATTSAASPARPRLEATRSHWSIPCIGLWSPFEDLSRVRTIPQNLASWSDSPKFAQERNHDAQYGPDGTSSTRGTSSATPLPPSSRIRGWRNWG